MFSGQRPEASPLHRRVFRRASLLDPRPLVLHFHAEKSVGCADQGRARIWGLKARLEERALASTWPRPTRLGLSYMPTCVPPSTMSSVGLLFFNLSRGTCVLPRLLVSVGPYCLERGLKLLP
jgi:hypothetical protein